MNTLMILEQLPPKGVKREQAILELGKDEANGELLFQLVNTEKGKCKTAAQKALAHLEYAPAAPLWAKLGHTPAAPKPFEQPFCTCPFLYSQAGETVRRLLPLCPAPKWPVLALHPWEAVVLKSS